MPDHARPDRTTREHEAEEAKQPVDAHDPGKMPSDDEAAAAERSAPADDEVAEKYEDQLEKSAAAKGEGRIE